MLKKIKKHIDAHLLTSPKMGRVTDAARNAISAEKVNEPRSRSPLSRSYVPHQLAPFCGTCSFLLEQQYNDYDLDYSNKDVLETSIGIIPSL